MCIKCWKQIVFIPVVWGWQPHYDIKTREPVATIFRRTSHD